MKYKFKVGDKVRILWHKTQYTYDSDYDSIGVVSDYYAQHNDTLLIGIFKFHKADEHFCLGFPSYAVLPLEVDIKDGDVL